MKSFVLNFSFYHELLVIALQYFGEWIGGFLIWSLNYSNYLGFKDKAICREASFQLKMNLKETRQDFEDNK